MMLDSMGDWVRTHYTSNVTPSLDGADVTLFGWVQEVRDLGGIRFVILQDREGTIQVTILKKRVSPEVLAKSAALQKRFSIGIKGTVKKTTMTPEASKSSNRTSHLQHSRRTASPRHNGQNACKHRSPP
jgi:aspartyl-tRNA synthetase